MLSRSGRFRADAMLGYLLVISLLAAWMAFAIRRIEADTTKQFSEIQNEEHKITLIERLRWSSELVVSAGRGYLISNDRQQLAKLHRTQADFEIALRALHNTNLSPKGEVLMVELEQAADQFQAVQQRLVNSPTLDAGLVAARFETEMLPVRRRLSGALDELIAHETSVIAQMYATAAHARSRLLSWVQASLAAVVLVGFAVAWHFAQKLARSYRSETEAVETARRALIARDQLMGIVAHDLRSPLSAILLKAEFVAVQTKDATTRGQAESIESIARRMEQLIRTMLDVTTIDAGQFTVNPEPCEVDEVVRTMLDTFGTVATAKQIVLEPDVREPGLVIHADRERLVQVLSNLLGNSIKFTPASGRVRLTVERVNASMRFEIVDTGPGIAPDHLPHIFDRYWKHGGKAAKGTGLGLFIAKSIVDAHGGRIWAESAPGQGTKFTVELPLEGGSTRVELARRHLRGHSG